GRAERVSRRAPAPEGGEGQREGDGLRKQICDGDRCGRSSQRGDALGWTTHRYTRVPPAERRGRVEYWLAIPLEPPIPPIADPVVADACARIQAALALAVPRETGQRDLDDQNGTYGMRVAMVARIARHDTKIGLGFRCFVERDGQLWSHAPSLSEGSIESAIRELDRGGVRTILRFLDDDITGKQLDAVLGSEEFEVGKPLVLDPSPLPCSHHRIAHAPIVVSAPALVNASDRIHQPMTLSASSAAAGGRSRGTRRGWRGAA